MHNAIIGFVLTLLVVIFLAQSTLSQTWVECNSSIVGEITNVNGISYMCVSGSGRFEWNVAATNPSLNLDATTTTIIIFVALIALFLILKKKKSTRAKRKKKR